MRAFTSDDAVQTVTGNPGATTTPGVGLPQSTTEGHAGLIVLAAQTIISPPEQWHILAGAGVGGTQLAIMCRADLPAGETGWTFTPISGTPNWCWLAEEWENVSNAPVGAASSRTNGTSAPASLSTGTTGTSTAAFVAAVAAVALMSTGGSAWPSVVWSNGFVETDVVSVGAGSVNADLQLRVARLYGAASDVGPWETTATFTGSMTSKTVSAVLAVLRAENDDQDT